MQSADYFNLLPAFIWWLLAVAFVVLWRIRITSWHCAIGFALTGAGFALDAYPTWGTLNPFLSGSCYVVAAYLYSGCALHHFGVEEHSRTRLSLALIFLPLHIYLLFAAQSLKADLFLSDMVFASFCFHAIFVSKPLAANAADRFFLISSGLSAAECVARSVFFTFFVSSPDQLAEFASSNYSVTIQIASVTIGLLFPISVLAAAATRAIENQRDAADIDPLTGLLNRRGFARLVRKTRSGNIRSGALLIFDIDHFKRVNDQFGHQTGDVVIEGLAAELRSGLGSASIIARFGGEEFVAYLPGATAQEALAAANSVNSQFRIHDWRDHRLTSPITVSVGVTNVDGAEFDVDVAVDRADKALYIAKDAGRDRVVVNVERHDYSSEDKGHRGGTMPSSADIHPIDYEASIKKRSA